MQAACIILNKTGEISNI